MLLGKRIIGNNQEHWTNLMVDDEQYVKSLK